MEEAAISGQGPVESVEPSKKKKYNDGDIYSYGIVTVNSCQDRAKASTQSGILLKNNES
jgi:hypothetical protein